MADAKYGTVDPSSLMQIKAELEWRDDIGAMSRHVSHFDRFASRVLPSGLPDSTAAEIRSFATEVSLRRDKTAPIVEEKPSLLFLAKGATKLVAHTALAREQIVGFHFTDDLVFVPPVAAHHYSLLALVDSELLVFPYHAIRAVAAKEPQLLGPLLDASIEAIARLRDKAVTLGRKTAPERVADFLESMQPRLGAADGDFSRLDLPMSRRDIADSLGLTIETVSRQFTLLREGGVIKTWGRGGVEIVDPAALAARSGRVLQAT